MKFFIVDTDNEHRRLDNYLISKFKFLPKTKIYSSLRKGSIRVNGRRKKQDYKIMKGDKITTPSFEPKIDLNDSANVDYLLQVIKKEIIYESKNFIVVDKPPNFAVHGGSGLNFGVIEIIRKLYLHSDSYNLAHRIDKMTSGCLIIARKMSALRDIHQQFRNRLVKKTYECFVHGSWPSNLKIIKNKIKKIKISEKERIVVQSDDGKESTTNFRIITRHENFTKLEVKPITGRTHQIRVHCANAGHPIVGDVKYAKVKSSNSKKLHLHAKKLIFNDNNEKVCVRSNKNLSLKNDI